MVKEKTDQSNTLRNWIYIAVGAITILTFMFNAFANIGKSREDIKLQTCRVDKNEVKLDSQEQRIVNVEKYITGIDIKLNYVQDSMKEQKQGSKEMFQLMQKIYNRGT